MNLGYLRDVHLLEDVAGEGLEAADVDGALLGASKVAAADAELSSGANHTLYHILVLKERKEGLEEREVPQVIPLGLSERIIFAAP